MQINLVRQWPNPGRKPHWLTVAIIDLSRMEENRMGEVLVNRVPDVHLARGVSAPGPESDGDLIDGPGARPAMDLRNDDGCCEQKKRQANEPHVSRSG